ncbi:MAG: gluconate kinase [Microbacterium sp. 69-10]|uniref:gluconokinase n=1 Tax=Microbacterium sp. 69-10 TaxID=1895783 RepID=UPI00096528AF|nr:gluconokinase [Microbacterium sp. 69-10]OJU38698.1 MAG: gluconate kinase [Microbacterium sp. 69-10]
MRVVVMGPSGCGKSTVGRALADALGARFVDGDDLHPSANVEKMAAGVPLTDEDRMPWLATVGAELGSDARIVIACSALRRVYRDAIRESEPGVFFAELTASRDELVRRMGQRGAHFMPASLLDSQLETLESLQPDESGVRIGGLAPADAVAASIAGELTRTQSLR